MAFRYPIETTTPCPHDIRCNSNVFVDEKVGIGTQYPNFSLDIESGRIRIRGNPQGGGGFWLSKSSTPTQSSSFVGRGTDSEAFVGFWNGSWKLVCRDANGDDRVGIGTTTPNNILDVNGTIRCDGLRIDRDPTYGVVDCSHYITIYLNTVKYRIPVYDPS